MIGNDPAHVAHDLGQIAENHGDAEAEKPSGKEETAKEEDERETVESDEGAVRS